MRPRLLAKRKGVSGVQVKLENWAANKKQLGMCRTGYAWFAVRA